MILGKGDLGIYIRVYKVVRVSESVTSVIQGQDDRTGKKRQQSTGPEVRGRDRKHNRYEDMRGKGERIVVVMVVVQ